VDLPAEPEDDVLATTTRRRLFAVLAELKRPVETGELAGRLALHPNGVRFHLDRLEAAGLVSRRRNRQTRGRPRDAWSITPEATPGGQPPRSYADLGRWLVRTIAARPDHLAEAENSAREIGRELALGAMHGGQEALLNTMSALGFQPRREPAADGTVTYRMGNCPYRDAVHENQQVVCTFHRGLTRGLLDILDPTAQLVGFEPHDPDTAGCLVALATPTPRAGRGSLSIGHCASQDPGTSGE